MLKSLLKKKYYCKYMKLVNILFFTPLICGIYGFISSKQEIIYIPKNQHNYHVPPNFRFGAPY